MYMYVLIGIYIQSGVTEFIGQTFKVYKRLKIEQLLITNLYSKIHYFSRYRT